MADLCEISRAHASRVDQAQKLILVPNLICIAGAFLFGFTGMTAVMLSNLGTLGLYRRASGFRSAGWRRPDRPGRVAAPGGPVEREKIPDDGADPHTDPGPRQTRCPSASKTCRRSWGSC